MVDIRTPFDDDSHTLHDGPLQRFFRMRKWFFATGVALLLLDTGWWDYAAASSALGFSVPKAVLHAAITLTGFYLMIQALLVASQIAFTYSDLILSRAKLIKAEAAAARRALAEKLRGQVGENLESLQAIVRQLCVRFASPAFSSRDYAVAQINYQRVYAEAEAAMPVVPDPLDPLREFKQYFVYQKLNFLAPLDPSEHLLLQRVMHAEMQMAIASEMQTEGSAALIMWSEAALDLMRIAPTLLFLMYGLVAHGSIALE